MGIAVDDFGTGYSNWTYLRDLPITAIKLDQSFTRDLAGSPKAQSVTQAVIGLASQLGYRVVAEGIETHDTFHLLQAWGCHEGQRLSDRPADAAGATGGLAAALANAGTWNGPYQHARQPRRVAQGLASKAQTR